MKSSSIKILLLESAEKSNNELRLMLNESGYQTDCLDDIDIVFEKILNQPVDLVICDNNVGEYNGFAVFKILMKYLRNYGIPFFLVLDSFEKEDMMIGLEIGIDNFIVYPINIDSVNYKIENQLRKRDELNIFKTDSFKEYFHSSLTPMFFIKEEKIVLVNKAFQKLYNGCTNEMFEIQLLNVFNIMENKQNELNYRRFQNGVTNYCKLVEVCCWKKTDSTFNLSFYRSRSPGSTQVFVEIVENHDYKAKDRIDEEKKSNITLDEPIYTGNIKLTHRELQVFRMSANGLPIKIIANELGLSERTVEKHRANIMAKANAKNMIEAINCIQQSFVPN